MIALVEGAKRQKTPNEIALNILLAALTIIFLLAVVTLQPFAPSTRGGRRSVGDRAGRAAGLPDPDHDRRAAVGDRHRRHGPAGAAQRARHVRPRGRGRRRRRHAAARQDRHDHLGNRQATEFIPVAGRDRSPSWPTRRSSVSLADETPRAARSSCWPSEVRPARARLRPPKAREFVPFTAQTRMSGVDLDGAAGPQGRGRRGDAKWVARERRRRPPPLGERSSTRSARGGTPLVVADGNAPRALGVIHLKDVVKAGIKERFDELRAMGIRP
jgi:K+-transporting ATPase ATPase B chain